MHTSSLISGSDEMMKLAETIAVKLEILSEDLPKSGNFDLETKLKSGTQMVADIAGACGVLDKDDAYYRLSRVRGDLFETMSILKLAHRLRKISLQPELMLEIKTLVSLIDDESGKLQAANL